jgi:hypothetical protein
MKVQNVMLAAIMTILIKNESTELQKDISVWENFGLGYSLLGKTCYVKIIGNITL